MSVSSKFLIFAVMFLLAVIGYLAVDHLAGGPAPTAQQAAPQPSPATPSPAPASASPAPAMAATDADEATARQAYAECVSGLFPTQADAQGRAIACSKALQSRQLKPDEVALARLTRGIARTALGDKALAGQDYVEAVQRYDWSVVAGEIMRVYETVSSVGAKVQVAT